MGSSLSWIIIISVVVAEITAVISGLFGGFSIEDSEILCNGDSDHDFSPEVPSVFTAISGLCVGVFGTSAIILPTEIIRTAEPVGLGTGLVYALLIIGGAAAMVSALVDHLVSTRDRIFRKVLAYRLPQALALRFQAVESLNIEDIREVARLASGLSRADQARMDIRAWVEPSISLRDMRTGKIIDYGQPSEEPAKIKMSFKERKNAQPAPTPSQVAFVKLL